MKYVWDNDLHIHSVLSLCSSDPEQTVERILEYARENNLKNIVVTDHFWDEKIPCESGWYREQNYERVSRSLPLPKEDGINFYFGCETELDKNLVLGMDKTTFDKFDFVVIPTTHLHMMGFTLTEKEDSVESRAELWIKRLEALLDMDLPFRKIGIAHLTCRLCTPEDRGYSMTEYKRFLDILPQKRLEEIFFRAAEKGTGIELNFGKEIYDEDVFPSIMRIYKTAKKCGCKFYFASDAHHPESFERIKAKAEKVIDALQLTEDDKFYIKK